MSTYNSDGYIMIDLSDVDVTKSTQNVPGIYSRILNVIDANKLILIVNHKGLTPQAAICNKLLNYYVITTNLYIYKINSNDIVIIEQSGSSSVEVSIIPTLMSGTKIADFAIGSVEGSLYAPEFESEINDNVTASNSTWSSDKINTELDTKADSSSLATVATTGYYSDLSGTPTIPVLTDLIDDSTTANNKVWSSDKTAAEIAAGAGVTIDDTTTSLSKTWSSDKIDTELSYKADTSTTYTKTEVDNALNSYQTKQDANLQTTATTVVGAINEINGKLIKRVSETIQLSQVTFTQSTSGMYYYEKTLNIPSGSLIVSISCGNWGKLRSTDIIEPYIAGSNKLGLMSNIGTFLNDAVIELIAIYV